MKIKVQDVVENLKKSLNPSGALSVAEAMVKSANGGKLGWTYSDLPDYNRIANESYVSDSMKKRLIQMAKTQFKEVDALRAFWTQVAAILRKQVKS